MSNDLDTLMSMDPLQLSDQDIEKIIQYERVQKMAFDNGVTPKKVKALNIDLSSVMAKLTAATPVQPTLSVKRRF